MAHDRAYWQGGSRGEKKEADKALGECVAGLGVPKVATLMKIGVWVGGSPYLPLHFRWGFGWPYPRGYKALTESERQLVRERRSKEGGDKPLAPK